MPMTKAEFKEAFRAAISSEFDGIPKSDAEIGYRFSPAFMKKMEKLLRAQKKPSWKFVNTGFKRFAIAALVAAMLLASACSFKAVRDSVVEFFTYVYETFAQIFLEGDTSAALPKPYRLDAPPEGFTETNRVETDLMSSVEYTNKDGFTIEITQYITDKGNIHIDLEKADSYFEIINGIKVNLCTTQDSSVAAYIKGQYYIKIRWTGETDVSVIKRIVRELR